jgi:dihydroneopterin aldolase
MDTVFIEQLELNIIIGVYDWEKLKPQRVLVDIAMAWDTRPAGEGDDLSLALDYKAVVDRVEELASTKPFELVETLADRIAQLLEDEFRVSACRLKVSKPDAIKNAAAVGVSISRGPAF